MFHLWAKLSMDSWNSHFHYLDVVLVLESQYFKLHDLYLEALTKAIVVLFELAIVVPLDSKRPKMH